jgi:hypothetical protein
VSAASTGSDPSTLQRIWLSLLGGPSYRLVAQRSRRVYPAFLLVAATTATIVSVTVAWSAHRGLLAISAAWSRLPDFVISDGRLVLPQGTVSPVRIAADGAVIVLEAQVLPGEDPLGSARAGVLVTAERLVLRVGRLSGADRQIPLADFGTTPLTKQGLGRLVDQLAETGVWLGAGLSVIYDVLRDLVRAAVVAWGGMMLVRLLGRATTWPEAWRVGLAAWTLPMLAEVAGTVVPVPAWALWLVASVYTLTGCLQSPPIE